MGSLAQVQFITIEGTEIRMDAQGRYCLNDLHKASGGEQKNQPRYWLENKQTQELVQVLTDSGIPLSPENEPINVIRGGLNQGTYVVKELVYSYAMWISPAFNLKVIRTFDAVVTGKVQPIIQAAKKPSELSSAFRSCMSIAKLCGLKGNQAILSADRATRKLTGESPLELLEITHLHAQVQEISLTPTQIGELLKTPVSARKVNILLESLDYQVKTGDQWLPTEKGKPFSEVLDTGKKHSDGTPVKQLKWYQSIVACLDMEKAA